MRRQNNSKNSRIMSHGLLLLLLLSMAFIVLLKIWRSRTKAITINKPEPNPARELPKRASMLYNILLSSGFNPVTAQIILSQAAHETGNFTSAIYLNNNNPFGMKMPKTRATYATKELNGYAYYTSIDDAVKDLKAWLSFNSLPVNYSNPGMYVYTIRQKSYFTDTYENYYNGVMYWHNKYFA